MLAFALSVLSSEETVLTAAFLKAEEELFANGNLRPCRQVWEIACYGKETPNHNMYAQEELVSHINTQFWFINA